MNVPVPTTPLFPFSAVVGHDDLRLALLLNAVHPGVGGVLVRGEKGTAKSTAVRALVALLPDVPVVEGCRFSCDPEEPDPGCPDGPHAPGSGSARPARLVELPVGATEDRLVGSLDLERALSAGVRAYQPGLLADAHRGVLYVDEVNLLHDHLVDLLLDAAAMGRAHVERDGVSIAHAARFLLVGTMNPEEGELRPQLLDRFGLTVEVRASRDVGTRVEVMRRRIAFEDDPAGFARTFSAAEADTAARLARARARVGDVRVDDRELRRIAAVCASFDVDGMRADLVMARAAAAHAAWRDADAVAEEDVRVAARLALPHRRRRDPFDEPGLDEKDLDEAMRDAAEQLDDDPDPTPPDGTPDDGTPDDGDTDATSAPQDGTDVTSGDDADGPPPSTGAGAHDSADGTDATSVPPRRDGCHIRAARGGERPNGRAGTVARDASSRSVPRPGSGRRRPAGSPCPASAPAHPDAAHAPAPTPAGSPARPTAPRPAPRTCTSRPRSQRPRRTSAPAAAPVPGSCWPAATCAAPNARAARATWCCSSSTRPARWRHASG